jgi:hypothetical protein
MDTTGWDYPTEEKPESVGARHTTEGGFILNCLMPLLGRLGFQMVRRTHGMDEYGRDILFYNRDRFGKQWLYAALVELGDISGAGKPSIEDLIAQIANALRMPYADIGQPRKRHIDGLYLIISGSFTSEARERIEEACEDKPVVLLDGQDLEEMESGLGWGRSRLARLQREAMAAARYSSEDIRGLEEKLKEMTGLEDCPVDEKVTALDELVLEVACHSDLGTRLLVEYLVLHIADWDDPAVVEIRFGLDHGRRLLRKIVSILAEIGYAAIVYGRDLPTVQAIVDATVDAADKARMVLAEEPFKACRTILVHMGERARLEGRKDLNFAIREGVGRLP